MGSATLRNGRSTLESKLAVKTWGTCIQQLDRKDCMERPWPLIWAELVWGQGTDKDFHAPLSLFFKSVIL
jgi:hypothetical protein